MRKNFWMSALKRKRIDSYTASTTMNMNTTPSIQITDSRFPGIGYRLGSIEEMKAKCRVTQASQRSRETDMVDQYALYVGRPWQSKCM